MTKHSPNIQNYDDLERHELKVRLRLKATEAELKQRAKQIPEEIISAALMRVVSVIVDGSAIRSVVDIVKRVGKSAFSRLFDDKET